MLKFIGKKLLLAVVLLLGVTVEAAPALKTIRFATEATYPPFESIGPSGQMQGFDIDVAKALCQKLQTQCEFSNVPFDSLIPSLQLGKYDAAIGAIDITSERRQQVDFTGPYYVNTASFVAAKTANLTLTPTSLKGKVVGIQQGTTLGTYLQAHYANVVTIKTYASIQDALLDLQAGRLNAVFGDTLVIADWVKQYGQGKYATIGQPIKERNYFGEGYGIAIRKGNTELLKALNQALIQLQQDGTLDQLTKQYFGV